MYRLQRDKNMNVFFYVSVTAGFICSFMHLVRVLFELILSIAFYRKLNLPAMAYIATQFFMIYIPLLLISHNGKTPKALVLQKLFLAISICYLLGSFWSIHYMIHTGSFTRFFTDNVNLLAIYQYDEAMMFNYKTWLCFSPLNVLYSLIQSFFFFLMAESILSHRAVFALSSLLSTLFAIIVPTIYLLFKPEPLDVVLSSKLLGYFYSNLLLLGTQFCITVALNAISTSPQLWERFLWTHSGNQQ